MKQRALRYKAASGPDVRTKDFLFQPAMADLENGQFAGYCAAFSNVDRAGEVILPGAFANTIPSFLKDGLICWQHDWTQPIGKPMEAKEDDHGLFIKGRIVDTPAGQTALTLMREGIVTKMSIGYQVKGYRVLSENEGRVLLGDTGYDQAIKDIPPWNDGIIALTDLELYEASPVSVPANPAAAIVAVKALASLDEKGALSSSLPLADRDVAWDASAADKRVRDWAGADDAPNAKYRRAFLWYDAENADNFGAYKLQIGDVIGGELKAVPRAVFAVAAVLQGSRGGVDIPDADKTKIKGTVERYYAKMRSQFNDDTIVVPWKDDDGKGAPRSGLRFSDHSEAVRLTVKEWVVRAHAIAEMYRKEGRTLNATNRQMLGDVREGIMAACNDLQDHADAIGELLTATDPDKAAPDAKAIERELMRFLALESRMVGISI